MKKTYTFYGNSSFVVSTAFLTAISFAKTGLKTAFIEFGQNNARLAYQLGIEDQRSKTVDYYLLNHKLQYHIDKCLLNAEQLVEHYLLDSEGLKDQIKQLPHNLSLIVKKPVPENVNINEDEWEELVNRLKAEIYENHDILIISTNGNMYGFEVFFPVLAADEVVLVAEDFPEDVRGLNRFSLDVNKINHNVKFHTVLLNHGIATQNDFLKTNLGISLNFNFKAIQSLRLATWECYQTQKKIKEIEMLSHILLGKSEEKAEKKESFFNRVKKVK